MSIPLRLYLGFALMAVALVWVAWSSHRSSLTAEAGLAGFKQSTEQSVVALGLRADVSELQRLVQVYSYTGHRALARRAREHIDDLASRLQRLEREAGPGDVAGLFKRLSNHVAAYDRNLDFAVEERSLRDQLVGERVPEIERRVNAMRLGQGGIDSATNDMFGLIQLNLQRYLVDPDYALLTECSDGVRTVLSSDEPTPAAGALLQEYERTFTRIVQATRGYLFLISVVLAGEAMEFSHTVDKLNQVSQQREHEIAERVEAGGRATRTLNLWGAAIAIALGIGLAVAIGRGISKPLASITSTLARLGAGDQGVEVPGTERRDEIGVMARAANVFRQQNERTAQLLDEARRLGAHLDEHKQQLERSNDELEQFVHTVSHDLKSPLVTSMGFLGIMRKLSDSGDFERACSRIEKLERAHRRMNQLISDLLDLSRVGRTDVNRDRLDVTTLIGELADDLRRANPGSSIVAGAIPPILGNESRVLQVFENLLNNAIKYGGSTVNIEVGGTTEGDRVRCFVRDDGPGIAPEHQDIVFGLFQRLQSDTEGTGVGLAVVHRIMASHGGSVRIESAGDGTGTTFWLEFPASPHDLRKAG